MQILLSFEWRFARAIAEYLSRYLSANQVTILRCLVAVLIIPAWVYGSFKVRCLIAIVWGICWYLDHIDGVMAREFAQASETGKWLDPLADKIQFYATAAPFWDISSHLALLLLFALDVFSTIERGFDSGGTKEMVGANWFGKWKTGFQIIAFFLFVLAVLFTTTRLAYTANVTLWISFLCSVISIIQRLQDSSLHDNKKPG